MKIPIEAVLAAINMVVAVVLIYQLAKQRDEIDEIAAKQQRFFSEMQEILNRIKDRSA